VHSHLTNSSITIRWVCTAWRPSFIVLHNTASPSFAQRLGGLTEEHIRNLEAFCRDTQRWSAALTCSSMPGHLGLHSAYGLTNPLTLYDKVSNAIEMLGD
jgi:hypothetical protein